MTTSLLNNANRLQKDAYSIVNALDLGTALDKSVEIKVVGSTAYNLMTWRDLDLDLVMPSIPDNATYLMLVRHFLTIPEIVKMTLIDNRNQIEKNRPRSMYLGARYKDSKSETWKLDLRLLSKNDVIEDSVAKLIEEKLSEKSRLNILKIKSQVHDNPNYHKSFSSVDIYEAVLLNKVTNLAGFKKYLKSLGKIF